MGTAYESENMPKEALPVDVPFGILPNGEASTVSMTRPLEGACSDLYGGVGELADAFVERLKSQGHERVELAGGSEGAREVLVFADGRPAACVDIWPRDVALDDAFERSMRRLRSGEVPESARIFVISNGAQTRYCSSTARRAHDGEGARGAGSIELMDWWADASGAPICDLMHFAKTFFAKHTLRNLLTKYCVPDGEGGARIMRPREIVELEGVGGD